MDNAIPLLIIDDSEDDRIFYRRTLLKSAGGAFAITEVDDGEKGLTAIEAEEPGCVLLDYSLPGRNGIEILKRIRSSHPFVPVVMLTGQGNENVAVSAMREGAQNYISKSSITPETLDHVIRMAIEHCTMQQRIDEQRNSLEVFTRALAHDLKEPVRTIRSFAELIAQYETYSPKAGEYLDHIQKAAARMHMLIDTVFLYTRLDDPGEMQKDMCDLNDVLGEVKENADHLIHERAATIEVGTLPVLYANRTQMIQLLQNLICNAIHHSVDPVTIRLDAQEQDENWVVCVADNGAGIEQNYLNKIFEPFKRLSRPGEQGAGLGLAICRKIVDSHGGRIWCESTVGVGTAFFFSLPKAMPDMKQKEEAPHAAKTYTEANGKQSLANILLVDDSRADVEITRFRLFERSKLQCNLMVARDGEEAITILNQNPVDLVLLDINMPEMDGFEVLQKIRAAESTKDTSIVMCSGSIYDKDMKRAFALGAAGYITKPIEFAKLKTIIDAIPGVRLAPQDSGYSLLRAA